MAGEGAEGVEVEPAKPAAVAATTAAAAAAEEEPWRERRGVPDARGMVGGTRARDEAEDMCRS